MGFHLFKRLNVGTNSVERFHRNLFDQVRSTRLQRSRDFNVVPCMVPPESLPWALQHTARSSWTLCTHQADTSLWELPLQLPLQHRWFWRMHSQRHPQQLRGNWLGRDIVTNEHILALPLQYNQHPSTTTQAYRRIQIIRLPQEEQRDLNFLKDICWPQLSDDINFETREHFDIYSCASQRERRTSNNFRVFDLQSLGPRHHPQAVAPPQEQHPTQRQKQPLPGLPQPPQAVLPRAPMFKQQAAPLLHALQAAHRPAGKPYNQPRGPPPPRPQTTNIIHLPQSAEHQCMLGPDLVDISVDSGLLQVTTNIESVEQQLQEDPIKQTLSLKTSMRMASASTHQMMARRPPHQNFTASARRTSMAKWTLTLLQQNNVHTSSSQVGVIWPRPYVPQLMTLTIL